MKLLFFSILLLFSSSIFTQQQAKRILFLGNSYTSVNNLPQMLQTLALTVGETLDYEANTPGGHTLNGHAINSTSLGKINQGNWDFVVLQDQSQYPAFPQAQVEVYVYPYARFLDSVINAENPCAETVFYMTWGRKNGDVSNCSNFPPLCTYEGMDSLLNLRYRTMANDNDAILSPVGAVWHALRTNHPTIELYAADESHPSVAGTYAAACSFFTTLFRKDPSLLTFDAGLSASDAATIRATVKAVVFDQLLEWNIGKFDVNALFSIAAINQLSMTFSNDSENADSYFWDFGDGTTSTEENPTHLFPASGPYVVQLTAESCGKTSVYSQNIGVVTAGVFEKSKDAFWQVYPNPTTDILTLELTDFSSRFYKILSLEGKVVQSEKLNATKTTLDLSELEAGVYVLQLRDKDVLLGAKLIRKE